MSAATLRTQPPATLIRAFAASFPARQAAVITTGPGGTVWVAAAPNGSDLLHLAAPELDAHLAFRLSRPGAPACRHDVVGVPLPPWGLYVGAVGWAWAAQGYTVPGLDAVVLSEQGVGPGFVWETGLAFAAAWQDLGGWPLPPGGLLGLMSRLGGFFRDG